LKRNEVFLNSSRASWAGPGRAQAGVLGGLGGLPLPVMPAAGVRGCTMMVPIWITQLNLSSTTTHDKVCRWLTGDVPPARNVLCHRPTTGRMPASARACAHGPRTAAGGSWGPADGCNAGNFAGNCAGNCAAQATPKRSTVGVHGSAEGQTGLHNPHITTLAKREHPESGAGTPT
jgi:hypothetical protein